MDAPVRFATAQDGVTVAWVVHGHGDGTPVVSLRPPQFSHVAREWDAGSSHHEFERYVEGRRVLRYDQRATGLSGRACSDLRLSAHVADLELVLAEARIDRVIVDAISSSALAGLAFTLLHPGRVERLILQNAFVDGARWWDNAVRRALVNIAMLDWSLCSETWAWLTWGDESRARTMRLAAHIRECVDPGDFVRMVEAERQVNLAESLSTIQVPTLVLNHPRFARMAPEEHNFAIAGAIRDARLHTIGSTRDRVEAVRAFIAGTALPAVNGRIGTMPAGSPAKLSPRELEILRLAADGLTNREIADRLFLSVRTVDAHMRSILGKTESPSRAGAAAFAIRHQLL